VEGSTLPKLNKLLSWLPSRCQDQTKGNPLTHPWYLKKRFPLLRYFGSSRLLSVWVYSGGCACPKLAPAADGLLAGRTGKVLRLTRTDLPAGLGLTTVDAVANPAAVGVAGCQQLYFCLSGRSWKIVFYCCLLFWLSASLRSSHNLSLLLFTV